MGSKRILVFIVIGLLAVFSLTSVAFSAESLNAYSIWPENWARPMFEEFEGSLI